MSDHVRVPGEARPVDRLLLERRRTCPECGRVFDLTDPDDAGEWAYGHDCEEVAVPPRSAETAATDARGIDRREWKGNRR